MPQEVDIAISGGSVEGLCTSVGFLKAIVEDLRMVPRAAAGNSAGGLVLCLYSARPEVGWLEETCLATDFSEFVSLPSWWQIWNIWRVYRRGWLSDGKALLRFLEKATQGKTFSDGVLDLRVVASNLSTHSLEVFDRSMYADMPLALAARITSCLPGGFKPVYYRGHLYWDGGPRKHYPIDLVPYSDRRLIGYLVGHVHAGHLVGDDPDTRPGLLGTLGTYIDDSVDGNVHASIERVDRPHVTIAYDDARVGSFDFDLPRERKVQLIEEARRRTVQAVEAR